MIIVNRKKIKNIIGRVRGEDIVISAPYFVSDRDIDDFLKKYEKKFNEEILKNKSRGYNNDLENNIAYLFGEKIYWYGSEDELSKLYRKKLFDVAMDIIKEYEDRGYEVEELSIRKMTSRWGTCYPKRKKIFLNLNLVKYPISKIRAVVIHELAHFKVPNHSKNFYEEVKKLMPEYFDEIIDL